MHISVIRVGNSKGIRLSKTLLDKYNIMDKLELVLEKDFIVLKPIPQPRKNWDQSFKEMHKNGDDQLIIDSVLEDDNWD